MPHSQEVPDPNSEATSTVQAEIVQRLSRLENEVKMVNARKPFEFSSPPLS